MLLLYDRGGGPSCLRLSDDHPELSWRPASGNVETSASVRLEVRSHCYRTLPELWWKARGTISVKLLQLCSEEARVGAAVAEVLHCC